MSRITLYSPASRESREVDLADRESLRKAITEMSSPERAFLRRVGLALGLITAERRTRPSRERIVRPCEQTRA